MGRVLRLMVALRERDPVRAGEAMQEHIQTVRDKALTGAVASSNIVD